MLLSNTAALGAAGTALTVNGGILDLMTTTTVNAYNLTVGGAATISSDRATAGAGITHILGTLSRSNASVLTINGGTNVTSGTAGITFGAVTHTAAPTYTVTNPVAAGTTTQLSLAAITGNANLITINGTGNIIQTGVWTTTGGLTYAGTGTGILNLSLANAISGTRTLTSGTMLLSNTAALGAAGTALTVNGGILDLMTTTTVNAYNLTVGGAATISSDKAASSAGITHVLGTLSIGANTLTVNKGTNATGTTAAVQFGNLTMTGAATLSPVSANLLMTGTSSGAYKLTKTGAYTLQKTTAGWTLGNDFEVSAGFYDANGQTTTVTGLTTLSGGEYQAKTATQTFNGGLTISGGTFTGAGGNVATTNLTLNSGVLTAPSGTFNITGDWTKSSGTFTPGSNTVTFSGSGSQSINSGGTSFNNLTITNTGGACTALSNITATSLDNGGTGNVAAILDMAGYTLTASSTDNTGATIRFSGTNNGIAIGTGTVEYSNTSGGQTVASGTYTNLTLSNTSGTQSTGGNLTVNTALTTSSGGTLNMGSNLLLGTPSTINHNGTIQTQNTSSTPIPSGNTWNGSGTVTYNGSSAQTAVAGTFYNLTIDNAVGVTLNNVANVNGTLLINIGRNLTINTSASMNAQTITNNAGIDGLIIKSDGLAPNGTLIVAGTAPQATVEMNCIGSALTTGPPASNYQWQYFGIPLQSLATASPTLDGSYVREYQESGTDTSSRWIQLSNNSSLTPTTGYEITQAATPKKIFFQGQLYNSNLSYNVAYTSAATYPGENLLSNPYTAAIDITQLVFGSNMDNTVYLYNTGSLDEWTTGGSGGIGTSAGQYIALPQNIATATTPTGLPREIPSMQGFLVIAISSSTLTLNYSTGVIKNGLNTTSQRARSVTNAEEIPFTIIDVKGSHFADRMWLFTVPTCTRNFDNGWDGRKIKGNVLSPQLYAMETDGKYQVNSVDDMNNTDLGFVPGEDTEYTLTFTHTNINNRYAGVYLMDLVENKILDVTESGSKYTFTASISDTEEKRFKIVTRYDQKNSTDTNSKIKLFSNNGTIFVQNLTESKGDLLVYDISGRLMKKLQFSPTNISAFSGFASGAYIVKATTSSDKVTERLIVR